VLRWRNFRHANNRFSPRGALRLTPRVPSERLKLNRCSITTEELFQTFSFSTVGFILVASYSTATEVCGLSFVTSSLVRWPSLTATMILCILRLRADQFPVQLPSPRYIRPLPYKRGAFFWMIVDVIVQHKQSPNDFVLRKFQVCFSIAERCILARMSFHSLVLGFC